MSWLIVSIVAPKTEMPMMHATIENISSGQKADSVASIRSPFVVAHPCLGRCRTRLTT